MSNWGNPLPITQQRCSSIFNQSMAGKFLHKPNEDEQKCVPPGQHLAKGLAQPAIFLVYLVLTLVFSQFFSFLEVWMNPVKRRRKQNRSEVI
ncbi:hypothetical protein [Nodularia sp. NIES-3585]|uniref:hypothetical protein n=1 Tax=Nodularia sp. NIES-3585 TaxID=1973477 RepID=UPI000B5CE004|nr:hypothetical protein [Nodularia sp. NIES-3585]GAX35934.1 polar amino acid ABC transporter inner membrane subunit [Nodularia sp. NIES-3585]